MLECHALFQKSLLDKSGVGRGHKLQAEWRFQPLRVGFSFLNCWVLTNKYNVMFSSVFLVVNINVLVSVLLLDRKFPRGLTKPSPFNKVTKFRHKRVKRIRPKKTKHTNPPKLKQPATSCCYGLLYKLSWKEASRAGREAINKTAPLLPAEVSLASQGNRTPRTAMHLKHFTGTK